MRRLNHECKRFRMPGDRYDGLRRRDAEVATIVLHGEADAATLPEASAGQEQFFTGPYQRRTLPGVGHFVPREAPAAVADSILALARS